MISQIGTFSNKKQNKQNFIKLKKFKHEIEKKRKKIIKTEIITNPLVQASLKLV